MSTPDWPAPIVVAVPLTPHVADVVLVTIAARHPEVIRTLVGTGYPIELIEAASERVLAMTDHDKSGALLSAVVQLAAAGIRDGG